MSVIEVIQKFLDENYRADRLGCEVTFTTVKVTDHRFKVTITIQPQPDDMSEPAEITVITADYDTAYKAVDCYAKFLRLKHWHSSERA